ncbi:alkaline phosphatase family protein [Flectobacillus rivi]|uniref:Ectonucleotide pyrophosphatase/phosphodiesterase n=1 Tax=Flectobacillus rivi TaxID=2984209 RepID=A0ABT6Z1V0_9BACT|nr:ectonucleotide pyrophosphatase/phosphodiesterase [Flectobacillus rivi]MDI9874614.1 ectonucleotide pyrophosphatase/phosphodiesterase [Flectobacillus rivi]
MKKLVSLVCFLCWALVSLGQNSDKPYVVMVSFDGFRHDYVQKYPVKHIKSFIKKGAAAEVMLPSYPSKTFPNHYTLVTGLYPDHHGLIDNTFYDAGRDTFYSIRQRDKVEDPYYYGGLPIWQLVQQNGMKAASYFWVGSEAPIGGQYPSYYHRFDDKVPHPKRVQAVFDWLNLPEAERPHLITIYFSMVDTQGHEYGPNAPETEAAVMEADSLVGMLMNGLKQIKLPVNVILTADHGMYEMQNRPETFIIADDFLEGLNKQDFLFVNNSTHGNIFLKNKDKADEIFNAIAAKEKHFKIYKKADIPEKLHFNTNARIGDMLLVVEPGYGFYNKESLAKKPEKRKVWGVHGFDPTACPEMGAIFYANGPNIKKGVKIPTFQNIHVYPFIAQLLGISTPPIDGDPKVLQGIIKK